MSKKDIYIDYCKAFGDNLKKIRLQNDMKTLSAVDKETAMNSSNYHKYELGKGNPTLKKILELAIAVGVNPKDLLDFEFHIDKEILKKEA
tara:strand:- start:506 stop:775 length:270 start_codon:yes stop_codon:yes gene_type:complete